VPLRKVVAALILMRVRAAQTAELAAQIENAVRAAESMLEQCDCGGTAGQHDEHCNVARTLAGR